MWYNGDTMKNAFLVLATLLAVTAVGAPVIPGDRTDPNYRPSSLPTGTIPPEDFRLPYISTYYVEPTVTPDQVVRIGFYVTDWDHSLVRFDDASFRFKVRLIYKEDKAKKWTTLQQTDVPSGDGGFTLGRLAPGDYTVGVWCVDAEGRSSHTVWHEFRVRTARELAVPERQVYRMKPADLGKYGIRNDDARERLAAEGKTPPKSANPKVPGYLVRYKAREDGLPVTGAFRTRTIAYDAGYDRGAVEEEAKANLKGLQTLIDEKAKNGIRKLVLLPGTYRISASGSVKMPDGFTLDLNGATLKENGFTGCHSVMVAFKDAKDAHLVNGTLAGDYWEHDYEHSEKGSEWPMGFDLSGDCRYCSVEGVTVRDITGYGGGNGCSGAFMLKQFSFVPGALDLKTGRLDEKAEGRITTDFCDIGKIVDGGERFVQISRYLGYQGFVYGGWWIHVCFYDGNQRFISGTTGVQYRHLLIPPRARYVRVTCPFGQVPSEMPELGFCAYLIKMPRNCRIVGCTFDHCRCVGYSGSAMKNQLFRDNLFVRSGEASAACAYDSEDGWDLMQDVTFRGNTWKDNPMNDMVTCAGHNFVLENNRCRLYMWDRTYSPCVRSNDFVSATFHCASRRRTGYGRYDGNSWGNGLTLGKTSEGYIDWDIAITHLGFGAGAKDAPKVTLGPTGRFTHCTFRNTDVKASLMSSCKLVGCTVAPGGATTNVYTHCEFKGCTFADRSATVFDSCSGSFK